MRTREEIAQELAAAAPISAPAAALMVAARRREAMIGAPGPTMPTTAVRPDAAARVARAAEKRTRKAARRARQVRP